jgi:hypothetical protein
MFNKRILAGGWEKKYQCFGFYDKLKKKKISGSYILGG